MDSTEVEGQLVQRLPVVLNLSVVKAVDSDPVLDLEEQVGLEA